MPDVIPYKAISLEVFWCYIRNTDAWPVSSTDACDNVIVTLEHFSRNGADFLQPLYFFREDRFEKAYTTYYIATTRLVIFVEWTILGEMTHLANTLALKGTPGETTYFLRQLSGFMKNLMPDEASLSPRIIAVIPPDDKMEDDEDLEFAYDWMEQAKRFPSDKEHSISQVLPDALTHNLQRSFSGWPDLHHRSKFVEMLESILSDDTMPRDITDYLLHELGFVDSWPRAMSDELFDKQITCSEDGIIIEDGKIYPPVKYIDHSHELAWKLTSRITHS